MEPLRGEGEEREALLRAQVGLNGRACEAFAVKPHSFLIAFQSSICATGNALTAAVLCEVRRGSRIDQALLIPDVNERALVVHIFAVFLCAAVCVF